MVAIQQRPPVIHRRPNYRTLYELHTAVLQAALKRYQENAISSEQFGTVLISFGSQFAAQPSEVEQVTLCKRFLRVLKGKVCAH